MRIARHPRADTLQKSVVPDLPARNGLIVSIPRRLSNAGQQCLHKRIDEGEQSLLPELDPADFAGQPVETSSEAILRRIDSAFTSRQLSFNRAADEGARIGEAAVTCGALDAFVEVRLQPHCANSEFLFGHLLFLNGKSGLSGAVTGGSTNV